jgi:Rieske Fe-S protein
MASDHPTRRRVLEICGRSAVAAAVLPAVGSLLGCPTDPPDETPDDEGWLALAIADYPELGESGGMVVVEVVDQGLTLAVARADGDQFVAIDAICSHAQCTLATFDASAEQFGCPCHGSTFAADGAVVDGPAATDLAAFDTEYDPDAETVRVKVD